MVGSEVRLTSPRYLDMQDIEDEPDCAANSMTIFEVLAHDAALPETNM